MAKKEPSTVGVEKLTGKDYMERPLVELQSHSDFSAHAWRVVEAIRKMDTKQLEQLNVMRGFKN